MSSGKWWDTSWVVTSGCTPVSPACDNCFASSLHTMRHKAYLAGKRMPECYSKPFSEIVLHEDRLELPLHWKKPRVVFVDSMSDLFHPQVPDDFIVHVWKRIAETPQHRYIVLTKRPERMAEMVNRWAGQEGKMVYAEVYEHLILGVTAENQEQADKRIPLLLATPAAKRMVSYEPALGPLDFWPEEGLFHPDMADWLHHLDWVIAGGETGPNARPAHPDWFRKVRDECAAAGVPFWLKSLGEWVPSDEVPSEYADTYSSKRHGSRNPSTLLPGALMVRVGKQAAGRLLDGVEHNGRPEVGPVEAGDGGSILGQSYRANSGIGHGFGGGR